MKLEGLVESKPAKYLQEGNIVYHSDGFVTNVGRFIRYIDDTDESKAEIKFADKSKKHITVDTDKLRKLIIIYPVNEPDSAIVPVKSDWKRLLDRGYVNSKRIINFTREEIKNSDTGILFRIRRNYYDQHHIGRVLFDTPSYNTNQVVEYVKKAFKYGKDGNSDALHELVKYLQK